MFDIVIRNGLIVSGSGEKPYPGSLFIKDGKIARVSHEVMPEAEAKEVIDAEGKVIAPGFIDIHTHSDLSYLASPEMRTSLSSGVTLEVGGNCGGSSIPVKDPDADPDMNGQPALFKGRVKRAAFAATDVTSYGESIQRNGSSINMGMLIGHGTLRSYVMGWEKRQLTAKETDEMCALLAEMFDQGALGVSLGLIYSPGSFCDTAEIDALAKVAAEYDRVLTVHMRNENARVFEALDEMVGVGKRSGARIEISHLKLMGKNQWGRAEELLRKIDDARSAGVVIGADQYPYTASHSGITSAIPLWAMDGGGGKLLERVKDEETWKRMTPEVLALLESRGGAENVTVSDFHGAGDELWLGKTLTEIADESGENLPETVRHLILATGGALSCFWKCMSEEDVLKILAKRDVAVVTDGTTYDPRDYGGRPHPRNTGSFPRALRLIRENALMPLEDAVRKCTSLPASVVGIDDRYGYLKEGYMASVTVFDAERITDRADYLDPTRPSEGIEAVIVNGEKVFEKGVFLPARPGKLVKK